jgi:hypothetical protein
LLSQCDEEKFSVGNIHGLLIAVSYWQGNELLIGSYESIILMETKRIILGVIRKGKNVIRYQDENLRENS